MKPYQIFLTIELARIAGIIDVQLQYDTTWEQGEALFKEFEGSEFNNPNVPEYEAIEAFVNDKFDTANKDVLKEIFLSREQAKYDQAKDTLEKMGYQVDNLWHIDDVKGRFECTDEEAMDVLIAALSNEATMEQIWLALEYEAKDEMGLTRIEEDGESDLDI